MDASDTGAEKCRRVRQPSYFGRQGKNRYTTQLSVGLDDVPTIDGVICFSDDIDVGDHPIGWKNHGVGAAGIWLGVADMTALTGSGRTGVQGNCFCAWTGCRCADIQAGTSTGTKAG